MNVLSELATAASRLRSCSIENVDKAVELANTAEKEIASFPAGYTGRESALGLLITAREMANDVKADIKADGPSGALIPYSDMLNTLEAAIAQVQG